ncbi:MAG: Hsp20 family protein [Candidatus Micrarchaeaceae archaeon]
MYYPDLLLNDYLNIFNKTSTADERKKIIDIVHTVEYPPINIKQKKDDNGTIYRIELFVAGYSKDEIKIELEDEILAVSGKKNKPLDDEGFKSEVTQFKILPEFMIKIKIPDILTTDDIESVFLDGVLTININKKQAYKKIKIPVY